MSHLYSKATLLVLFIFSTSLIVSAQSEGDCKVLKTEISGQYSGECKKGLADGIGEAKGTDSYSGSFKKGLPNGKGIYKYANGAVYEGSFVNGKRHGQGTLSYTNEGELVTEEGLWDKDNYIGKKAEPAYVINRKLNVLRYSFVKTRDTRPIVSVKIIRNGTTIYPDNLLLAGSSGSVIQQRTLTAFEQIQFPFQGSIKYSLLSQFNNSYIDYELDFTIKEPGYWQIVLSH